MKVNPYAIIVYECTWAENSSKSKVNGSLEGSESI